MSVQYCGFTANGTLYGLPVADVQELLRPLVVTPVPLASHDVAGLINLRGQIVPTIDLRRRLNLPDRETGQPSMNVVVCTPSGPVALVVDTVVDVIETETTWFEPVPDTVPTASKEFVTAACKLENRLLLILNAVRIVQVGPTLGDSELASDAQQSGNPQKTTQEMLYV
jgi:purine-binding chemotaxis protein CheW